MNNVSVDLHRYYNKFINFHNYTQIDMSQDKIN